MQKHKFIAWALSRISRPCFTGICVLCSNHCSSNWVCLLFHINTDLGFSIQLLRSNCFSRHVSARSSIILSSFQLRDLEMSHHYEDRSSESTFRDSRSHSQDNSEPPDLPMPTCFRSRSHSYLRAIQAGCSQDDDTASVDSGCSPPLTDTTVRTYSTSTGECCFLYLWNCMNWIWWVKETKWMVVVNLGYLCPYINTIYQW